MSLTVMHMILNEVNIWAIIEGHKSLVISQQNQAQFYWYKCFSNQNIEKEWLKKRSQTIVSLLLT